jgi:hypothetical protein
VDTLIELYDAVPIENVLATEMFRPREMILLCPPDIEQNREFRRSLRTYFEYRQCPVKLTFIPVSMLDAVKIERVLRELVETHPDCAIDISGGTDAALFAAGAVSGGTPVFTYSRKKNAFFEIKNAPGGVDAEARRAHVVRAADDGGAVFLERARVDDGARIARADPLRRETEEKHARERKERPPRAAETAEGGKPFGEKR